MKTQNTGIRIEAVKKVNSRGKGGYKITRIRSLAKEELPQKYLEGEQPTVALSLDQQTDRLYLSKGKKRFFIQGLNYISSTFFYSCEDMEKILSHVKEAGQHLADVNNHLRKEREAWNGKVVFVDGVQQKSESETVLNKNSSDKPIKLKDQRNGQCQQVETVQHKPGRKNDTVQLYKKLG